MKKEDEEISLKDFRETFYKCRNFEISHLWQRSIFLTAFLVICFTGYGKIYELLVIDNCITPWMFNLSALGIAFVGIIFSVIWIAMGKGSKAWYEVYETAICYIEDDMYSSDDSYKMNDLAGTIKREKHLKDTLYTNKAGPYSVSKLNIIIGRILLIIWAVIMIFHFVLLINFPDFQQCFNIPQIIYLLFSIVCSIIFCLLLIFVIIKIIKCFSFSNTLGEKGYERRRKRPLEKIYTIVFFDKLEVKMRQENQFSKTVYFALAICLDGRKELLGVWIKKDKKENIGLKILKDLKSREVKEILIIDDNEIIEIRNSLRKIFPDCSVLDKVLKKENATESENVGKKVFDDFYNKWNKQLRESWRKRLLQVPKDILLFPTNDEIFKLFYLIFWNKRDKSIMPIKNWRRVLDYTTTLLGEEQKKYYIDHFTIRPLIKIKQIFYRLFVWRSVN